MEHVHSIILIKRGDKYLNYFDERWGMYLFPNIKGKDDLVQIGCFGLIKAVDSYELEKKVHLQRMQRDAYIMKFLCHLEKIKKH